MSTLLQRNVSLANASNIISKIHKIFPVLGTQNVYQKIHKIFEFTVLQVSDENICAEMRKHHIHMFVTFV